MKILVIDTAGATASVSVINEKKEIFTELSDDRMSHLQMLMPVAKRTMEKAGVKKEEITHVAVAVGPGSFTGIRIGMAAAMTLAQAWDLPMAAVSSLSDDRRPSRSGFLRGIFVCGCAERRGISAKDRKRGKASERSGICRADGLCRRNGSLR